MPALVGELAAARQVDVRELEQGNALVAGVDISQRRRREPLEQRRSEHGLLAREWFLEPECLRVCFLRNQAPGVGLEVAEADERVLDGAADALELGQPAEHL